MLFQKDIQLGLGTNDDQVMKSYPFTFSADDSFSVSLKMSRCMLLPNQYSRKSSHCAQEGLGL